MTKGLCLLVAILCSEVTFSKARNLGHRAGGGPKEYHKHLPENSLSALRASLVGVEKSDPIQYHRNFRYLEFDVRETRDGRLVIFHDTTLKRMLPNKGVNRKRIRTLIKQLEDERFGPRGKIKYKKLGVKDLSLSQLKSLILENTANERVPTLEEFLMKCREWGLSKPLTLEVKEINSEMAKHRLIELLRDFREDYFSRVEVKFEDGYDMAPSGVSLLSFPKAFKKSFGEKGTPEWRFWCGKMKEMGLKKVYRAVFHSVDLCRE